MITLNTYAELEALQNHEDGEVAFVANEKQDYVYHEGWKEITADSEGLSINLYEINKSFYSQLDPLTDEVLEYLRKDIDKNFKGNYYLLYGKEISYFTLFEHLNDNKANGTLGQNLLDCLKDFEKVYSFELKENEDTAEIWVHNKDNELATVLYLFNYENGVVYYD